MNIYNIDEKGFALGIQGMHRLIINRNDPRPTISQEVSREWITLIECVGIEKELSPMIIFKGKRQPDAWYNSDIALSGGAIGMSANGWTDNELGLSWLTKIFGPSTYDRLEDKKEYRLLIFDGHASHITNAVIEYCNANRIIMLCLPPHTTHLLQPLDVCLFSPLQTAYKDHLHALFSQGQGYSITKIDFLKIIYQARKDALTPLNIVKSWTKTGLIPFNPSLVLAQLPIPFGNSIIDRCT